MYTTCFIDSTAAERKERCDNPQEVSRHAEALWRQAMA
jgi:hypothetical protein